VDIVIAEAAALEKAKRAARLVCVVSAAAAMLSACETMERGSTRKIAVSTYPEVNASCVVSNKEGSWPAVSPGTVTVARSRGDLTVRCSKAGYADAAETYRAKHAPTTHASKDPSWLDVPGALVDSSAGAYFLYPDAVVLKMTGTEPAIPSP
jgi:hypothetical protein